MCNTSLTTSSHSCHDFMGGTHNFVLAVEALVAIYRPPVSKRILNLCLIGHIQLFSFMLDDFPHLISLHKWRRMFFRQKL